VFGATTTCISADTRTACSKASSAETLSRSAHGRVHRQDPEAALHRKWDLQTTPSICVHCGLGCNTIAGERDRSLRRIANRFHHEVNGYFLCDRGRFGYEFVNSDNRIRSASISAPSPLRRAGRGEALRPVGKEAALAHIAAILAKNKGIIGIGSPRASLESNFALRTLVGPENFYSGMSDKDHALVSRIIDILGKGPARSSSLNDVRNADAVLSWERT